MALVGFALVGLGLANVFPLAIARAGALGGAIGRGAGLDRRLHRPARRPARDRAARRRVGLPAALATVSLLAAVAAALSLYATPQRALLTHA